MKSHKTGLATTKHSGKHNISIELHRIILKFVSLILLSLASAKVSSELSCFLVVMSLQVSMLSTSLQRTARIEYGGLPQACWLPSCWNLWLHCGDSAFAGKILVGTFVVHPFGTAAFPRRVGFHRIGSSSSIVGTELLLEG